MAEHTEIAWCDSTFNPWIGCTKVSPGCANCYAERLNNRMMWCVWGPTGKRQRTSETYWKQPLKWDRESIDIDGRTNYYDERGEHRRPRVFCASLADWLDDDVPVEWLADLLDLILRTPHLDWLLLTKRPQNSRARLIAARGIMFSDPLDVADRIDSWLDGLAWRNVWIGTTVENQQAADDRIPALLNIPARVRFLSCEPLLGPVYLSFGNPKWRTAESYHAEIHWVIVGGESGPRARPMHPDWARSLRDQCAAAGVPFLFKQWGEYISRPAVGATWPDGTSVPDSACPVVFGRVGKHAAGRLLDGREHNEFPEVRS